jgi:hypothetical protein
MTFQQIADFIRKTYPTATMVELEVTHNVIKLRVIYEEPDLSHGVEQLNGVRVELRADR